MRRQRPGSFLALLLSTGLLLAACGSKPAASSAPPTPAPGSAPAQPAAPSYPKMQVRIGSIYVDQLIEGQAVKRFADAVTQASGGQITFKLTFGTSLGSQNELSDLASTGGLDMTVHGLAPSPQYNALFLPYAIVGYDHMEKVIQSPVATAWAKETADKTGLLTMYVWNRGNRVTYLKAPAEKFEDLAGRKIRVPKIDALVNTVKSWKATPVVMDFGELYTGLASGAVEGAENTMGQILAEKHYEVAKYVLVTNHSISPVFWLANTKWLNGLPKNVQDLLRNELTKAAQWAVQQNKAQEDGWAKQLQEKGVKVVAPANMKPFYDAAAGFVDAEASKVWGADAWKQIQAMRP